MSTPPTSVVYVALGGRRTGAARRVSAHLAAGGTGVLLVVPDRPEWADVDLGPGVTVHRAGTASPAATLREVRGYLCRADGPLATAGLLIAGDPEAMPVADAARRRFPELTVRTEWADQPGRTPAPADLAVVTPWYPSPNDPFAGAFVRSATASVIGDVGRIATLQTENWFYSPKGVPGKLIGVTLERELAREPGYVVEDTPEGELTRVVTPQLTDGNYYTWAQAQIDRLAAVLPTGRIEAPLIHAHTGHYAGGVAAALARDDARIVLTEHATFLDDIWAQPAARRMYGETLARANRVLCVGQALHDQIADRFPQHADKLRIVPNPVDFDRFAARPEPPAAPLRWLYVGRMLEHKGVRTLVDAFARIAAEEPRATLTLVGSGPLEGPLRRRIAELGLADRITQVPAVPPDEVVALLHDHDLLAHASSIETFGMTVIEAVATGTPVLVARSKGPAETLAGLDGVGGVLFDVTDDPDVVADAYRKLAANWSGLDLAGAREKLMARYGREAVGAQLREIYREVLAEEPAREQEPVEELPPLAPGARRIAVVAIRPPGVNRTRRFVTRARQSGYGVDVITLDPADWAEHERDPGVRVHAIGDREQARITRRLKESVVTVFPRWSLGFARARARALPSPVPEAVVIHAQRGHRMLARAFNNRVYERWYLVVRPRILWRIARRHVAPTLDMARISRVVVHGVPGVTIGWELARRHPEVPVASDYTLPAEDTGVREKART